VESWVGETAVHWVSHGSGRPAIILHGAGVDHREAEACFEPALGAAGGLWRIYPDLPGMGRTPASAGLQSADDVLDLLIGLAEGVAGTDPVVLVGHSAGAYYAQGIAARRPDRVLGLALICPLLPDVRDVPEHHAVVAADDVGDEDFRSYFVVQTPAMLERYQRFVAPALPLADQAALERIGQRWVLNGTDGPAYHGPTLVVAGRQDSTVGYAAAAELVERYPRATLAVLDGAGHALPHEQPEVLACLLAEWVARTFAGG
jgi:pimeloyl-ACP methyl ester carboxylesterase